jgi:DNA-binding LacI/PurR family transcriptional regulator
LQCLIAWLESRYRCKALRLGHRRISLLEGDPASIYVAQPRERGYLRAMTEAKCTPVTATSSFFYGSGVAGVDELQCRGLRVPEDISVPGFDNTSTSQHVNPPLSTMAQPLEEVGRMAVKKLLRSRDLGPKITPHRLIERGSASCLS